MKDCLIDPLEEEFLELKVVDYWVKRQGWKWDSLQHLLPATKMIHLAGTVISSSSEDQDVSVV